jgi:hypothetical protein
MSASGKERRASIRGPRGLRRSSRPPRPTRWELIRDVAVFQLKLALDALRDVVLSPVSLAAALVDLLTGGERPGHYFYRALVLGRRAEHWINLFGEADRVAPPDAAEAGAASIDEVVGQVEERIRREYERGGVTASAKAAIDRSLDAVTRSGPRRDAP